MTFLQSEQLSRFLRRLNNVTNGPSPEWPRFHSATHRDQPKAMAQDWWKSLFWHGTEPRVSEQLGRHDWHGIIRHVFSRISRFLFWDTKISVLPISLSSTIHSAFARPSKVDWSWNVSIQVPKASSLGQSAINHHPFAYDYLLPVCADALVLTLDSAKIIRCFRVTYFSSILQEPTHVLHASGKTPL